MNSVQNDDGEYIQSNHSIRCQPLHTMGRNDYSRLHIQAHAQYGYINEAEIRKRIGQALTEFSKEFATHDFVITKLTYGGNERDLIGCSFVVILPKQIRMNAFNRFLSQGWFQLASK